MGRKCPFGLFVLIGEFILRTTVPEKPNLRDMGTVCCVLAPPVVAPRGPGAARAGRGGPCTGPVLPNLRTNRSAAACKPLAD